MNFYWLLRLHWQISNFQFFKHSTSKVVFNSPVPQEGWPKCAILSMGHSISTGHMFKDIFRWSESRCLLSHERSSPAGQAKIVANPPTEYFSRVCLNSKFLCNVSFFFFKSPFFSFQKTTWLLSVETRPTVSQCGRTQPLTHQIAKRSVAFSPPLNFAQYF